MVYPYAMYAQREQKPAERLIRVSELIDAGKPPREIVAETEVSRSEVMAAFRWTKIINWRKKEGGRPEKGAA